MDPFDVIVVGAGPAGATAATLLARYGRRVALLDAAEFPRPALCAGWLSARAQPLLERLQVSLADLDAAPFESARFYSADLAKTATPRFSSPPGFRVDRRTFDHALVRAAQSAGAQFLGGQRMVDVDPREREVQVGIAGREAVRGRLAIIATGRDTPPLAGLKFTRPAKGAAVWSALIEVGDAAEPDPKPLANNPKRTTTAAKRASPPSPLLSIRGTTMLVVFSLNRAGWFATIVRQPKRSVVCMHSRTSQQEALADLKGLLDRLISQKLIGAPLVRGNIADAIRVVGSPAGVALDLETHVGKHALLVGDAGGFVCATSNEGLHPAMWSAQIAAEVVHEALDAHNSQDVLMQFETRWRTEMGEYLRMPNTDIQLLLPLVFSNQAMADRMGAAFFFGENV